MPFDGKRMIYGGFRVIAHEHNDTGQRSGGYVHGFVAAIQNEHRVTYERRARAAAAVFKKHGAWSYMECWGDDIPEGQSTSFPQAVQCREDETVVSGWTVFPDKKTHDAATKKIMSDDEFPDLSQIPFDGKRLIHAGFQVIIDE